MAVKDIYVPYEEFVNQVYKVEDDIIGCIFMKIFGSKQMLDLMQDQYVLKYPFQRSYFEHCVEISLRQIIKFGAIQTLVHELESMTIQRENSLSYQDASDLIKRITQENPEGVITFSVPQFDDDSDLFTLSREEIKRNVIIFKFQNSDIIIPIDFGC